MTGSASARHEFRAVIDGLEIPPEVADRINRAVQKAVLNEIAELDLRKEITVQLTIPPGPAESRIQDFGRTDGIQLTLA